MACMLIGFRPWSERCLVQGLDYVLDLESVLARHGFYIAVVACGSIVQLLEDLNGFGVTLLHIPDDHVTADQLIESKHRFVPRNG